MAIRLIAVEADSYVPAEQNSPGHTGDDHSEHFACQQCGGHVLQTEYGIDAPDCLTTQSCEFSMARLRPELFDTVSEGGQSPCAQCDACVELRRDSHAGDIGVRIVSGTCRVDRAGEVYRETGRFAMDHMPLTGIASCNDLASIAGDPVSPDSDRCTGNRVQNLLNEGVAPPSTTFACSFADATGEHCNQVLTLEADVLSGDHGEWLDGCKLRAHYFAEDGEII